jgi:hypothetical protein
MIYLIDLNKPSITDWIQSVGVVIAAIGLIINFVYQRKSTNAQIKATLSQVALAKRDFQRYLIEITPQFVFKSVNIETVDVFVSIEVINQSVIDFYAENLSPELIAVNEWVGRPKAIPVGGNIGISYQPKHEFDIFDEYGFTYEFELHYKDIIGNSYSQKITAYSNSTVVNFDLPKRKLKKDYEDT